MACLKVAFCVAGHYFVPSGMSHYCRSVCVCVDIRFVNLDVFQHATIESSHIRGNRLHGTGADAATTVVELLPVEYCCLIFCFSDELGVSDFCTCRVAMT